VDRLHNALVTHDEAHPEQLLETIAKLLDAWVGNEPHTDDVTMMLISRLDEAGEPGNNRNDS
jgi:serine phosphatase RsbU (regulator of sigma subunit)